ncbi:hypothetical protein AQJ58_00325 [Streptomyces sp. DSM 15324]|nr:hypothetical protein AQJ58_00325 [Streptomyces sp. DSM 15324]
MSGWREFGRRFPDGTLDDFLGHFCGGRLIAFPAPVAATAATRFRFRFRAALPIMFQGVRTASRNEPHALSAVDSSRPGNGFLRAEPTASAALTG